MTHAELVKVAYRWVMGSAACGFAFRELVTIGWETPDVIGFRSGMSVLVECKTSRSDFLADRKKPFRIHPFMGMGRFRFYCCPEGLIKQEELPDRWGLIYVNDKGKARCVYNPYIVRGSQTCMWQNAHEHNQKAEQDIMYSALLRLQKSGHIETIYRESMKIQTVECEPE